MTPAEFVAGLALLPFAVGAIVAAELWSPIMDEEPAIAWADCTDRFPDDARLRQAGWEILRRPARGPAVWVLKSINNEVIVEMPFADAVKTLGKLEDYKATGKKLRG